MNKKKSSKNLARICISADTHRRIRLEAAKADCSIKAFVEKIFANDVDIKSIHVPSACPCDTSLIHEEDGNG